MKAPDVPKQGGVVVKPSPKHSEQYYYDYEVKMKKKAGKHQVGLLEVSGSARKSVSHSGTRQFILETQRTK